MLKYTSDKLKGIRFVLYSFTAIFYFLMIGDDIYGGSANVGGFILNRCLFYIAEAALLTVLYIRCRKKPEGFCDEYFQKTVSFKKAADTCLMMIIIVTVFAAAEMIPFISYLSYDIFHGSVNGPLAVLLLTAAISVLHFLVVRKFFRLEEQNELLKPPPPKQEDIYAFVRSADENREDKEESQWKLCTLCGAENPPQLRQCVFCGGELTGGKDDPDV